MLYALLQGLFVGGTNRGWGSRGSQPFTFERVRFKGKVPFEMHDISARADGFEVTFTQPVDAAAAADVKNYTMDTFTYIYQSSYGSPEVDQTTPTVKSATVSADGLKVRLVVDGLVRGHIHHLVLGESDSASPVGGRHRRAARGLHPQQLERLGLRLAALDPQRVLDRGYAWLSDEAGHALTRAGQLSAGQHVQATLADGTARLVVR